MTKKCYPQCLSDHYCDDDWFDCRVCIKSGYDLTVCKICLHCDNCFRPQPRLFFKPKRVDNTIKDATNVLEMF